jgi:hypothetical protein
MCWNDICMHSSFTIYIFSSTRWIISNILIFFSGVVENSIYRVINLGFCVAWLLATVVSNASISVRIWRTKTLCCVKPSGSNNPATECRIEDTSAQFLDFQITFLGPNWQAVSVCFRQTASPSKVVDD